MTFFCELCFLNVFKVTKNLLPRFFETVAAYRQKSGNESIMNDNIMKSGQKYWRSLEQLADTPEFRAKLQQEFPLGAAELEVKAGVDRRNFLGILGASLALAGVTSTGCIRKPKEKILPYANRPEDLVEGVAQQYATALHVGTGVLGVLITSHENRPTKVEGNPLHPMSLGATNSWAQAAILDLYDPDRSQFPAEKANKISWEQAESALKDFGSAMKNARGSGYGILIEGTPSPSLRALLSEIQALAPGVRLFTEDSSVRVNQQKGFASLGLSGYEPLLELDKAQVIVSLESDFLGTEGDVVRQTKLFSAGRRLTGGRQGMSRLYAVEPAFSTTGAMADNRLQLRSSEVGDFLLALAVELGNRGLSISEVLLSKAKSFSVKESYAKWATGLAADLSANAGRSIIVVGEKQPAWVHAAAIALNDALRATGQTINYAPNPLSFSDAGNLTDLASAISGGAVSNLLALGTNPAYSAADDLGLSKLLLDLKQFVHVAYYLNETAQLASLHIPSSHAFESWGDLRCSDGTVSICQPLIEPIYRSFSALEVLARVAEREQKNPYEIVKNFWKSQNVTGVTLSEAAWNKSLHDGVVESSQQKPGFLQSLNLAGLSSLLGNASQLPAAETGFVEVSFPYSSAVFDGRYANNAWLQELPDTVTKLTWDNAALLSPKTATSLGVKNTQVIELQVEGRTLKIPAWITPGVAENVIVVPLGWGRKFAGGVCSGTGFNANQLRSHQSPFVATGVKVSLTNETYVLASTQDHGSMEGRAIVRESTVEQYKAEPAFVDKFEIMPKAKQKTLLWDRPWDYKTGQQWGMSIDLNACTGCNACSVACTSENNVSVVGKTRVADGREMHWIRIDRYFTGSVDNPQVVVQPVGCQHCESAPCEQVCPVGATAHSPDGMNDMAYNRCIGTRYCANNCPFKVRRFNYFAYAKENDESNPLYAMQKNPNVTVRFRGVIEKCSYKCCKNSSEEVYQRSRS